eukprot:1159528-Pelagomonas_calceolata.AAC.3
MGSGMTRGKLSLLATTCAGNILERYLGSTCLIWAFLLHHHHHHHQSLQSWTITSDCGGGHPSSGWPCWHAGSLGLPAPSWCSLERKGKGQLVLSSQ